MAFGNTIGNLLVRIGVDASALSAEINTVEKRFEQLGTRMYFMGGRITQGVTVPILAAVGAITKFGAEFDQAMTESLAIMDNVSDKMRADMESVAQSVSETTKFSAKEAAEGYYHLASAGLTAAEAMKALPVVAQFAQAGVMDLAKASEYLAGATAAVGLKSDDASEQMTNMARVADVLTEANNKALGTIQDFAAGLSGKLGPQLRVFNKTVEEGTALLMGYAQQNIKGTAASQQAYIFLRDMARFAAKKPGEWTGAGINVFDAMGNMRNVADIINDITKAMNKAAAAGGDLAKVNLFKSLGFTDRSRAATQYLLGMGDDIRKFQTDLENASGATAKVAQAQMESITNQMKAAWHEVQNELIKVFISFKPTIEQYIIPAIRALGDWLERLAGYFTRMTPQTKAWVLALTAAFAALGPGVALMGSWILLLRAATAPLQMLTSALKALTAAQVANSVATKGALGGGLAKSALTNAMLLGATRNAVGGVGETSLAMQAGISAVIAQSGANAGKVIAQAAAQAEKQAVAAAVQVIARQSPENAARIAQAGRAAMASVAGSAAWTALQPAQRTTMVYAAKAEAQAAEAAAIKAAQATGFWGEMLGMVGTALKVLTSPLVMTTAAIVEFAVATVRETGSFRSLYEIIEAIIPPLGIMTGMLKGMGLESKFLDPFSAIAEGAKSLWGALRLVGEAFSWVDTIAGKFGAHIADLGKTFEDVGSSWGDIIAEKMQEAWLEIASLWAKFKEWLTGQKPPAREGGLSMKAPEMGGMPWYDIAYAKIGNAIGITDLTQKIHDTEDGRRGLSDWFRDAKELSELWRFSLSKDVDQVGSLDEALRRSAGVMGGWEAYKNSILNRGGLVVPTSRLGQGAATQKFAEMLRIGKLSWEDLKKDYANQNPDVRARNEMAQDEATSEHKNAIANLVGQLVGDGGTVARNMAEAWASLTTAQKNNTQVVGNMIDEYDKLRTKIPANTWAQNVADWWYSLTDAQRLNKANMGSLWDVYEKLRKTMSAEELKKSPLEWIFQDYIATEKYQETLKGTIATMEELDKVRAQYKSDISTELSDKATNLWAASEKATKANTVLFPGLITAPLNEQIQVFQKLGPVLDEIAQKAAWDTIPAEIQVLIHQYWELGKAGALSMEVLDKRTAEASKNIEASFDTMRGKLDDTLGDLSIMQTGFEGRDFKGLKRTLGAEAAKMAKSEQASWLLWAQMPDMTDAQIGIKQAKRKQLEAVEAGNKAILATERRANILRLAEGAGLTDKTTSKWAKTNVAEADALRQQLLAQGVAVADVDAYMAEIYEWAAKTDDLESETYATWVKKLMAVERFKKQMEQVASIGQSIADILNSLGFTGAGAAVSGGITKGLAVGQNLLALKYGETVLDKVQGGIQAAASAADLIMNVRNTKGKGNRALMGAAGGAMTGMSVGFMFGGPLGAGIGAVVGGVAGLVGGLLTGDPMWERVGKTIGKKLGISLSDETAKHISESIKNDFKGDEVSGTLFNLNDIIKEAGGIKVDNIDKFLGMMHDVFSMLETGKFTLAQTTQVLDENFGAFADFIVKSGKVAGKAFTDLLDLNQRFKTNSVAVKEFISSMTKQFAEGGVKVLEAMGSQFKFSIPDVEFPGTGKTKSYTLDQYVAQTEAADQKVKELKERISDLQLTIAGRKGGPTPRQAEELQELKDELAEAEKVQQSLKDLQATAKEKVGPEMERIGRLIVAMFNGAIAKGQSVIEVMNDLAPMLDKYTAYQKATGYETDNPALKDLLAFRQLIKDNEKLVAGIEGANQMLLALANTGSLTQDTFNDMTTQAGEMYTKLLDAGFSERQAMTILAPMLSNIIKAAEQYGFKIDENTMKLILQGREMGLIKDDELTTNDILLQGLAAIIKALGGEVPEAWKKMLEKNKKETGDSAEDSANEAVNRFGDVVGKYKPPKWWIEYGYKSDGSNIPSGPGSGGGGGGGGTNPTDPREPEDPKNRGRNEDLVPMAEGGLLTGPRAVWAGEAGPEAIVPLDRLFSEMQEVRASQGTGTTNLYWSVTAVDENGVEKFFNEKGLPAMQRIMRNNQFKHRTKTRESMGID